MDEGNHAREERIAAALERLSHVEPESDHRMLVFPADSHEVPPEEAEHANVRAVEDDGVMLVYRSTECP